MAVQKYIINKSDLPALIKGEDLSLPPKGDIRGFCIEVEEELTNGDVLTGLFPEWEITILNDRIQVIGENYVFRNEYPLDWWNAPYKRGDEDADSN